MCMNNLIFLSNEKYVLLLLNILLGLLFSSFNITSAVSPILHSNDRMKRDKDNQPNGQQPFEQRQPSQRRFSLPVPSIDFYDSHRLTSEFEHHNEPFYKEKISRLNVDGVLDFTAAETRLQKFIWALVLILTFSMLIVQIGLTVNTYLTSPLSSTWSVEPLDDKNFPVLYLCPVYVTESSWFLSSGVFVEIDDYLNAIFSNNEFGFDPSIYSSNDTGKISDFVKACYFERKAINCSTVSTEVFDPKYGACVVINVGKPQQKVDFGLTLVLNVGEKSFPAAIHGAVLTIMDNYTSLGGLTDVLLQAGQWSKIILDASRYTMINTNSYSTKQDCFDDERERPVYKSLTGGQKYTKQLCELDCTQNLINKYCNQSFSLQKMQNQSRNDACKHGYLSFCVFKAVKDHLDELETCKSACRVPCRFWQYGIRMSHMKLGDHGRQLHERQQCYKSSASGQMCLPETIVVDIGYQTLFYTDISQSISITWDTFIGNIGGQVGLWMGISVVSLCQLFLLLITACLDKSKKAKIVPRKYKLSKADGK